MGVCVPFLERFAHKPFISDELRNATAVVGGSLELLCRVTSDLHPHIVWVKHYQVNGSYKSENGTSYYRAIHPPSTVQDKHQQVGRFCTTQICISSCTRKMNLLRGAGIFLETRNLHDFFSFFSIRFNRLVVDEATINLLCYFSINSQLCSASLFSIKTNKSKCARLRSRLSFYGNIFLKIARFCMASC